MTRPTIVVFDLGGVLIDWNPRHHFREVFAGDDDAMERFLTGICSPAWNERQDGGRSIAEAEAELIARHPGQATLIRSFYGGFDRIMRGAIAGSVAILEELHAADIPLFAITNFSAETYPLAKRRFDFLARFRDVVVSGAVKAMKPQPTIFRILLDRHGLSAAQCVFIDDSLANVDGARGVGMHALHFRSPDRLRADLIALGLPLRAP